MSGADSNVDAEKMTRSTQTMQLQSYFGGITICQKLAMLQHWIFRYL